MQTPNVPKIQGVQSRIPKKYLKMSFLQHKQLCAHCAPPCIFRYFPNLGSFIVHKLQKSKNIQKVQDNYFSKCPNTTEILPPFRSHQNNYSRRNKQKLLYHLIMITLYGFQRVAKFRQYQDILKNIYPGPSGYFWISTIYELCWVELG